MKKRISTAQIGDNKLPNKYWVSICEDYYITEDNCLNWISEKNLFKPKSKIIGNVIKKIFLNRSKL